MKEYKYKINGNSYKVTIGDIEDNIAHVEVNGTHYKVEMDTQPPCPLERERERLGRSVGATPQGTGFQRDHQDRRDIDHRLYPDHGGQG